MAESVAQAYLSVSAVAFKSSRLGPVFAVDAALIKSCDGVGLGVVSILNTGVGVSMIAGNAVLAGVIFELLFVISVSVADTGVLVTVGIGFEIFSIKNGRGGKS